MPQQYLALKRKYGSQKAAKIYVGLGKGKYDRSQRAKSLHHSRKYQ